MKKKQDQDAQGVSELLKKLQASFAAPEKSTPSKKKKNADDVDDLKFQEKLSAMLSKITDPTVKKGKKSKSTDRSPSKSLIDEDLEETVDEALEETTDELIEESVEEPVEEPVEKTVEEIIENTAEEVIEEISPVTASSDIPDNDTAQADAEPLEESESAPDLSAEAPSKNAEKKNKTSARNKPRKAAVPKKEERVEAPLTESTPTDVSEESQVPSIADENEVTESLPQGQEPTTVTDVAEPTKKELSKKKAKKHAEKKQPQQGIEADVPPSPTEPQPPQTASDEPSLPQHSEEPITEEAAVPTVEPAQAPIETAVAEQSETPTENQIEQTAFVDAPEAEPSVTSQTERPTPPSEASVQEIPHAVHPLDKVIPLPQEQSLPSVSPTPSIPKKPQETAPKVEQNKKTTALPQADEQPKAIEKEPHTPKAEATKKAPMPRQDTPTVIKPKNDPRPAPPLKSRNPNEPPPIVIRPTASVSHSTETIVIQPRAAEKTKPVPQLQTPEVASPPIKIGKEVKTEEAPTPVSMSEDSTTQTMKKESTAPSVSKIAPARVNEQPTSATVAKSEAKDKSKADAPKRDTPKKLPLTRPTAEGAQPSNKTERTGHKKEAYKSTVSERKSPNRKMRRVINDIPISPLPNDDDLEEVLEEAPEVSASSEPVEIPVDEPETQIPHPQKNTRFQKKKQQKQAAEEQKLSAMDLVRQRCGLSEDDVAMIFELGYENELGRLVGYENLKRLKNEHLKRVGLNEHKHYRTAYGYRGEEYASTQQRDTVMAAYIHDRKQLIVRVLLTALCTLALLFVDIPQLIGSTLTDLSYPLLPILGMLLLVGCAALSHRQIVAGLFSFFKFSPTPYSVPALLIPTALVYDLVSVIVGGDLLRVNFLSSLVILFSVISDVLRFMTELRALQIASTEGPKHVLAPATPRKKKLRLGNKIVKIINDDIGEDRYQVRSSVHTVGHFRRFNNMHSVTRPFTVFLVSAFALATLNAFVTAVSTSSVMSAISSFMTVLLLCTPVTAVFTFFYPLFCANRLLSKKGCTLVGDEAVEEYDHPKTVIFRDTDLYSAEKCTEISVRTGDDFQNDLQLAGALFRKLGGTLGHTGQSTAAAKEAPPVSVVRVQDNGVEAMIDNRYHVLLGNAAFLTRGGVRVPKESTDRILRRTANVGLMYVAIDGVLKLSYEIEYHAKKSFERIIRDLAETNCTAAIFSYDPNLNEVFLQKSRPNAYEAVQVIKPGRFEEDKPLEFTDTGAIALNDSRDIVYPLHAAHGVGRVRRFGWRIQMISSLLGALLVALLTLFGNGAELTIATIMGYQIFWTAVSLLATHTELNTDKLHFRK